MTATIPINEEALPEGEVEEVGSQPTQVKGRWTDTDPLREGESAEERLARQHTVDIDNLARAEISNGKPNPRLGQRKRSGETSEGMQSEVRERIAALSKQTTEEFILPESGQVLELNESQKEVIKLLKSNFDRHDNKVKSGIKFDDFETYLKVDPKRVDKLTLLAKRGGELTVVSNEGGKFQLEELAVEPPIADRDMDYRNAVEIAKEKYGAKLMTKARYEDRVAQGFYFNYQAFDWLAPDLEAIDSRFAFFGCQSRVALNPAHFTRNRGFRATIEV